ncbi:thioredoxin [Clostridium chrysemydis]|uniref:thioredoxin n=1 Tax=Clostridium chrysemydis TaxID=2665504 RepID=UPI001884309A|nr:thioredoxin [Clostridium chrysemydis]
MIKEIYDADFKKEVLDYDGIVFVEFFATWCPHCKALAPLLESVSEEVWKVKFVKVDIDKNPQASVFYDVESIPTLKIFKSGEVINTNDGFLPKEQLINFISESI